MLKIINNGLLQAPTLQVLLKTFHPVFECCHRNNLTRSRPKLKVGQSVIFSDYEISQDGVRPEARKTDAILNFPIPENITELRSFLGFANQLGVQMLHKRYLPSQRNLHLHG